MAQDPKKRDYKKEYREYQGTPEQKHNRALRNAARRELEREGLVHKGDHKDVGHKKALISGGSNKRTNLHVESIRHNRGWERNPGSKP